MHTLSPNLDRLGAALRALRQTHDPDPKDKAALGVKCLAVVISQLSEDGLAKEDLRPLIELEASLSDRRKGLRGDGVANRRKGAAPSEAFLGRVAAVIDLLVKAGYEEGEAAQMILRRLLAAGVSAPRKGGDARGWKRLLEWRADLGYGLASEEGSAAYKAFTKELETIPANERVKRVLDEQLWDRRRLPS